MAVEDPLTTTSLLLLALLWLTKKTSARNWRCCIPEQIGCRLSLLTLLWLLRLLLLVSEQTEAGPCCPRRLGWLAEYRWFRSSVAS